MNLPSYADGVPSVTTPQMIEVDRAMVEDYRIELIQMPGDPTLPIGEPD